MKTFTMRFAFVLVVAFWFGGAAAHGEVTVSANVSSRDAEAGEPLQFQIEILGSRDVVNPPEISIDGVEVKYVGPSQQISAKRINNQYSRVVNTTHVFRLVPRKEGDLTIPPIEVEVEGRKYRTKPIALKVAPPNTAGKPVTTKDGQTLGWAEIVPAKTTAYVGESVPVEIRVYFDERIARSQVERRPEIVGEGFTRQEVSDPSKENGRKDGRNFEVHVLRTAITPSRAGTITLGPTDITAVISVQRQQRRTRSPFDFFADDFFSDIFDQATHRVQLQAGAVDLQVKPLPTEGRPQNFTGAVGQFEFSAEGKPSKVKIGDPVTMKMTLMGQGDFDRISEPKLVDPKGWQTYPPSKDFQPSDDVGASGTMTWDMAVVPEEKKDRMPRFAFSYFDPKAEKYVTLTTPEAPLIVEGEPPPAASPVNGEAEIANPEAANEPTRQPEEEKPELAEFRNDRGAVKDTFAPIYTQRWFWIVQAIPGAAFLGLIVVRLRSRSEAAVRAAKLMRMRAVAWERMEDAATRAEFYEEAARVLQFDTALECDREPASIDAEVVRAVRTLDEEEHAVVQAVFDERAELVFAGSDGGKGERVSIEGRQRIRQILTRLMGRHEKK